MVRYELILRRHPKLQAVDIPKRLGDLPKEFSEGTLRQALADPTLTGIAIAWGDSRSRLLTVKRRIEILGGAVDLIDRAGPFRKGLTELRDRLGSFGRQPESKRAPTGVDPDRIGVVWIVGAALLVVGALVFAQRAHSEVMRTHALRAAGGVLGMISARLFVRGVQRWFAGHERPLVSVCLALGPCLMFAGASYHAYNSGVFSKAAAALPKPPGMSQPKPSMKPFAALLAELRRREQRAELTAALAGATPDDTTAAIALALQEPVVPAAPGDPVAATAENERVRVMDAKSPADTTTRTGPIIALTEPYSRVVAALGMSVAWPLSLAAPAVQPAAAVSWCLASWPSALAPETVTHHTPAPRPAPRVVLQEPVDPLRAIADVNGIQLAGALVLALLMFALGFRIGRRRTAPALLPEAPNAVVSAPVVSSAPVRVSSRPAVAEAPAADSAHLVPLPAANENAAPVAPRRVSARRDAGTGTSYSTHGGIQEEHVAPRKRDARRDD